MGWKGDPWFPVFVALFLDDQCPSNVALDLCWSHFFIYFDSSGRGIRWLLSAGMRIYKHSRLRVQSQTLRTWDSRQDYDLLHNVLFHCRLCYMSPHFSEQSDKYKFSYLSMDCKQLKELIGHCFKSAITKYSVAGYQMFYVFSSCKKYLLLFLIKQ